MRVSFAGLMLCEANFNAPKDKAAAKLVDVELAAELDEECVDCAFLAGCRFN